jgi:hypothetical protein
MRIYAGMRTHSFPIAKQPVEALWSVDVEINTILSLVSKLREFTLDVLVEI